MPTVISDRSSVTIPVELHTRVMQMGLEQPEALSLALGLACLRLTQDPTNTLPHLLGRQKAGNDIANNRKSYGIPWQCWEWVKKLRAQHLEANPNLSKMIEMGLNDWINFARGGHSNDALWAWCCQVLGTSQQPAPAARVKKPKANQTYTYTDAAGTYVSTQDREEASQVLKSGKPVWVWNVKTSAWDSWS